MYKQALTILVLTLISSCSWYESERFRHELERSRKEALLKIDKEKCASKNGKIEGVGMFGTPACVHYYSDAGKSCSKKSDCEGYCMGNENQKVGETTAGICQKSEQDQFGCFTIIDDGKISTSICQD